MRVIYNLGSRFNGLSAAEVIKVHYYHAVDNKAVVFTTNRIPKDDKLDKLTEIILTTQDGKTAMSAKIENIGKYDDGVCPYPYKVPSLWNHEPKNSKAWFVLKDASLIQVQRGAYHCLETGSDVLDSIKSPADMVYTN